MRLRKHRAFARLAGRARDGGRRRLAPVLSSADAPLPAASDPDAAGSFCTSEGRLRPAGTGRYLLHEAGRDRFVVGVAVGYLRDG